MGFIIDFEDSERRSFLLTLVGAGTLGGLVLTEFVKNCFAMGAFKYPTGIQKLKGKVLLNGVSAAEGDILKPGDMVETGPGSMVIFIVDKSVYLLRANTRLEIQIEQSTSPKKAGIEIARILNGKVLAVFGRRREKRLITQTAVAGIRGSAAYVEAEPERTYICLCYGKADLRVKDSPSVFESVQTSHHEAPRYIYKPGRDTLIEPAPVMNHTDAELIMLEGIAWRRPPFVDKDDGGNGGGGY